jgi:mono/diheme cytochrome c family protein
MKLKITLTLSIFILLTSCSNNSQSDLTVNNIPSTITYTNTIKSIMDTNCISCHGTTPSNGAGTSLKTYQNVKDAVLNNSLIEKISKAQGSSGMMPFGGTRLNQTKIDEVINWKNNGFAQ